MLLKAFTIPAMHVNPSYALTQLKLYNFYISYTLLLLFLLFDKINMQKLSPKQNHIVKIQNSDISTH